MTAQLGLDPFAILAQRYAPEPAAPRTVTPGALAVAATAGRELQAPHLELIDDAYARIAAGKVTKRGVIITMPPRHGKSQRTSRWGPIWYLRRFPNRRVVLAGYAQEFINTHARWVRDTIESPPWVAGEPFDLGLRIKQTSKAVDRWDIDGHDGGMVAVGVGGPLTGRGADLLIIDDPVKDAAEADSKTIRDRIWDWWETTASTRLEPGGKVIVIMTRWHEDDLVGRLLAREGDQWEHIDLPALAGEDDPIGREPGDPLWPARFDRDALQDRRARTSARWWAALYQQRPAPPEGSVWRGEWIAEHRTLVGNVPPLVAKVVAVDPATTSGESAAETGIVAAALGQDGHGYVLDDRTMRGTPREWALAAWRLVLDIGADCVVVEDNQGGEMTADVLKSAWDAVIAPELARVGRSRLMPPIRRVHAAVGKRLRAEPVAVYYEHGQVHHVADGTDRLAELEQQQIGWTGTGPSPDRLDALVHVLTYLFLPGQTKAGQPTVVAQGRWGGSTGRR